MITLLLQKNELYLVHTITILCQVLIQFMNIKNSIKNNNVENIRLKTSIFLYFFCKIHIKKVSNLILNLFERV